MDDKIDQRRKAEMNRFSEFTEIYVIGSDNKVIIFFLIVEFILREGDELLFELFNMVVFM